MKQIMLSHPGKQHSYQVAKAMFGLGCLYEFFTSSYIRNHNLQKYLVKTGNQYWTRRFIRGLPGKHVNANWRFELKEIALRQLSGKSMIVQNAVYSRDVQFDKYITKKIKNCRADIFWGFQGSCCQSLNAANKKGMISVCELATAHVTAAKHILNEEAKLHPEWADSIDNVAFPSDYEKRLEQEPRIARYIVAASDFTASTLKNDGISSKKIIKLPLGYDISSLTFKKEREDISSRPLRLLYAGTVTQRKGIKYLLEAMKRLNTKDIQLHIIGGIQGSGKALEYYKQYFIYNHPVSQEKMFEEYSKFDALVLPTVFEGFGLVILEAMAVGLPVITTSHSIGPELIVNNINGYVVPVRNVDALVNVIELLRNKTNNQYSTMRREARKSAEAYSWDFYRKNLSGILANQIICYAD